MATKQKKATAVEKKLIGLADVVIMAAERSKDPTFAIPIRALSNVSFKLAAGERVGLIGRIGSGKSTIEKLVLGLYKPTSGSILIDGVDVNQIDPATLRKNIGYVPQDIVLFYGSVKENIMFAAPYADDTALIRARTVTGRPLIDPGTGWTQGHCLCHPTVVL